MQVSKFTSKKFLNFLYLQHYLTSLIVILIYATLLFIWHPITRHQAFEQDMHLRMLNILIFVQSSFSLVEFIVGEYLSRKKIEKAKAKILITEKAQDYLQAKQIKYLILVVLIFMAMLFYIIVPVIGIMILTFALILLLVINYPTKAKMMQELELNQRERDIINHPQNILGKQNLNHRS